jgi:hypothetical protein
MSIELHDSFNEPIHINSDNNKFSVVWRNITKQFNNPIYKSLQAEDITNINNFQIGELKALLFKINNDNFTFIYEPIDTRSLIDKDGYPIKFEISGPSCQRTLYVTWSITSDFNKVNVCHVNNNVTTNDIEFIKILCHPQDLPHGVLVSINGIKHEVIDTKTKYENSTYYKNHMWQTIKSELACATDAETASKILEHARLVEILENKDIITLARTIDMQNDTVKKLTEDLRNTKTVLENQIQNYNELKDTCDNLQMQNKKYIDDRDTFKKELTSKLAKVVNEF